MNLLKQSTAVTIRIGPFLDKTDGVTEETGLSPAATDVQVSKNHGAWANKNDATAPTHDSDGWYTCVLDATDTGTLGHFKVKSQDNTTHLPVWHEFTVVPANTYNSLVAGTSPISADVQWWNSSPVATPTQSGVPEVDVTHWLGTAAATPTVAGVPEVDITHVLGDATSATDLKDFADAGYDPITNKVQGVVLVDTTTTNTDMRGTDSALLAASAPTNFSDLAITVTTGQVTVGTNNDKTGYSISGAKTTLDALNDITTAQVNTEVDTGLTDFFTSSAQLVDDIWDEALTAGTHNVADSGGRRLRFLQEGAIYSDGAIYIDTVNGAAGTTDYENGTPANPVSTIADANTLATSLGISKFVVLPGSSITFAATQSNQSFEGAGWTLALGGQNIAGTIIKGASVTGIGSGSGAEFHGCDVGTSTLADCTLKRCSLSGTITLSAASDYYLEQCFSAVAGAGTPTIDFGAAVANTNLSMRHYSGGVTINNKDNTGTDQMSIEGNGQLVVAASSSGAISVRGNFKVTNTGGATITYDDNTQNISDILTDTGTTLDTKLNDIQGATFSSATDSLEAIRDRGDAAWITGSGTGLTALASGTAQAGTASTIQLAAGETFADDELNGNIVKITSGTGAGQSRVITDYTGSTDTATITPDWATNPDATSVYEVVNGSANLVAISNDAQSVTDLKDFADAGYDPATNKVEGVKLVDTTTTNTDMRGTDSALLASSAPTNFSDLAITVTTGQVTVGTNNDKTGYSISGTKTTLDALNDLSAAEVNTEVDNALDTAIPGVPTADSINERIKAIDDKLPAGTISDFDETTDPVEILDTGGTAGTSASELVDDVWDEPTAGHTTPSTMGEQMVTDVDAILADTADMQPKLGTPAGADMSADIAALQADLPNRPTKNTALSNFMFMMLDSADDVTPKTGETVTAQRSIDGAAFGACANSVSEIGNGWYKINLAASDLNGDTIALKFTSAGASATNILITTQTT